jgi:CRISPR-associated protein Csb2
MLLIELAFPAGRYHATPWGRHVNEGVCEWPPSPYRLIRALYDAWKRKRPDWSEQRVAELLEALASAPPSYRIPPAAVSHTKSYLSQNERNPAAKTAIFDGFVALSPRSTLLMGWPEVQLDAAKCTDLDELLSQLNYLGRSESWIGVRVVEGVRDVDWNCRPAAGNEDSDSELDKVPLAVPTPPADYSPPKLKKPINGKESLSWMDAIATGTDVILKLGWSHPPAMRFVDYLRPADCFAVSPQPWAERRGTSIDAVLYALDSKVLPQVTETVEVAERARTLLMGIHKRIMGDPAKVSPRFSGKSASGSPSKGHSHAFFLPQDRDGDGRVDHLLVRCSEPFDDGELRALDLLGAIWQRDGRPDLICTPVQWTAAGRALCLESATPFIPPRHWRPGRGPFGRWLSEEAARECRNHGLPVPVKVEPVAELRIRGSRSIHWMEFRRNRKEDRVRSGYGLRMDFDEPVPEALALGYGCHFGLGQFRSLDRV